MKAIITTSSLPDFAVGELIQAEIQLFQCKGGFFVRIYLFLAGGTNQSDQALSNH